MGPPNAPVSCVRRGGFFGDSGRGGGGGYSSFPVTSGSGRREIFRGGGGGGGGGYSSFGSESSRPIRSTQRQYPGRDLLEIFRHYLNASQQLWPTLVFICRKWLRIVFASQQPLHLRLFCTYGMPIQNSLGFWPALPIFLKYGRSPANDPPVLQDVDNIMAALKQSGRAISINRNVTSVIPGTYLAISTPLSALEDIGLLSRDRERQTLPFSLRGTPVSSHRRLHSTRIAVFPLLQFLSSMNLVDLQLHEVLNPWHLSPEALTNALSGMVQLQSLSLYFLSTDIYVARPLSPSSWAVLPVLTRFNFRGFAEYLEGLVSRINAPLLADIELTSFNEFVTEPSHLHEFINRIEMHRSHQLAHLLASEQGISISLTRPGSLPRLKLQLLCEPLSQKLSSITQICTHFSALLSNVEDLRIKVTGKSGPRGGPNSSPWLELLKSFKGVKRFHVAGNLSMDVVTVLQRSKTVLPALHKLFISQLKPLNAPLREAVVSIMVSRRLSGHPIAVEYERLCFIRRLPETGPFPQKETIEVLNDDTLLNIFRHYLDATSPFWPTLVWVCQRWRQIIFTSPLGLNLRLCCTYGTPVLKTLDCWPSLPILVQYGGIPNVDPPAPEDDANIITALQQYSRVSSISLTVTRSLLEKLSAISEPFSELEELVLFSRDNLQLTVPSTFQLGPRLRVLRSTRIDFPTFRQLLSLSQGLVELKLCEIPTAGYFPPEYFANTLSGMTQLETLSLHFLSLPSRRTYNWPSLSGERVVLPALTCLKYRGTSKYLDSFVVRIDAPHLEDIDITFFSQPTMDALEFGRFIERIEMRTSLVQADVETSAHAISISFTNSSSSTPLRLQISCKQLDWQLSGMAQVCGRISPFLFNINNLGINTAQAPSAGQDDVNREQWLDLVRSFKFCGAKSFWVAGELTTEIMSALGPTDRGNTYILPSLRHLRVGEPLAMYGPSWDAVRSFITPRCLSGYPVQINALSYLCHICRGTFEQPQELRRHLRDTYAYRILCSYCGDFECTPGHDDLFREHLESDHPEVSRNDACISKPSLTPFQLDSLFSWHSSLRAPEIVSPSPTATVLLTRQRLSHPLTRPRRCHSQ